MTKRIFRSVILTALAVFLACLALVMGALYSYFSARQEKQLGTELALAAAGVEANGLSYLESLGRRDGLRLTWVDADGTVIFDSNADAASMENHAAREEIGPGARDRQRRGQPRLGHAQREDGVPRAAALGRHGTTRRGLALHGADPASGHPAAAAAHNHTGARALGAAGLAALEAHRGPAQRHRPRQPAGERDLRRALAPAHTRGAAAEADTLPARRACPAQARIRGRHGQHGRGAHPARQGRLHPEHQPRGVPDLRGVRGLRGPGHTDGGPLAGAAGRDRARARGREGRGGDRAHGPRVPADGEPRIRRRRGAAHLRRHGAAPGRAHPARVHGERLARAQDPAALHHGRGGAARGGAGEARRRGRILRPHPLGGGEAPGAHRGRHRPLPARRGRGLPGRGDGSARAGARCGLAARPGGAGAGHGDKGSRAARRP